MAEEEGPKGLEWPSDEELEAREVRRFVRRAALALKLESALPPAAEPGVRERG